MDYHKITNLFFSKPFISISEFEKEMNIAHITSIRNIKRLEENNVVKSIKI
jgi:predicted transcriptional regulator